MEKKAMPHGMRISEEKVAEQEAKFAALTDEQASWFRVEMKIVLEVISSQLEKVATGSVSTWYRWAEQTEVRNMDRLLDLAAGRLPKLEPEQIVKAVMLYTAFREVLGEVVTPNEVIVEIGKRSPDHQDYVRKTVMDNMDSIQYQIDQLYETFVS